MQRKILIDLGFDCSSGTDDPVDIAKEVMTKIKNFCQGEGAEKPDERFNTNNNSLYVNIKIPGDIDKGKVLETKLDNNLDQFPPLFDNLRRFVYMSEPDPIEPEPEPDPE